MNDLLIVPLLWMGSVLMTLVAYCLLRRIRSPLGSGLGAGIFALLLTPSAIEKCDRFIVPAWYLVLWTMADWLPGWSEIGGGAAIFVVVCCVSMIAERRYWGLSSTNQEGMREDGTQLKADGKIQRRRGVGRSIVGATFLLAWDIVVDGSFVFSFLACPVWFLVSVVKNAIQRPGWRLALIRMAIPVATFGLVLANNAFQLRNAETNAPRVIAACEAFYAANGKYPERLEDLVPDYFPAVPRAKWCLLFGEFRYWNDGSPTLVWCVVPPHGRRIYTFEDRRWGYLD